MRKIPQGPPPAGDGRKGATGGRAGAGVVAVVEEGVAPGIGWARGVEATPRGEAPVSRSCAYP